MGWNYCAILALTIVSQLSHAYPTPVDFSGRLMRWDIDIDNPVIRYEVISETVYDEANFYSFVDEAAYFWSNVETSFIDLDRAFTGDQAQITVKFTETISGGNFSSGFAVFDEFDDEGRPTHCTITIVATEYILSLQKTILHELGHCLGLGHTLVPEAIMSYSLDKNSYALDTDDRAAVTRLYPADGSEPQLPPGCSTGSWYSYDGKVPFFAFFLLGLPLLIAIVPRKIKLGG